MHMAFKDRLKELRRNRGITQEELAKILNIPESSIRRYESSDSGYPSPKRVSSMADYFGVSTDYLYERDSDPIYIKELADRSYRAKLIDEVKDMDEDDAKNVYHIVKKIKK